MRTKENSVALKTDARTIKRQCIHELKTTDITENTERKTPPQSRTRIEQQRVAVRNKTNLATEAFLPLPPLSHPLSHFHSPRLQHDTNSNQKMKVENISDERERRAGITEDRIATQHLQGNTHNQETTTTHTKSDARSLSTGVRQQIMRQPKRRIGQR